MLGIVEGFHKADLTLAPSSSLSVGATAYGGFLAVVDVADDDYVGVRVLESDGSTNVLPIGTPDEVAAAWANHLRLVRRSLARGYYQGWDLHPAQLPTRFAVIPRKGQTSDIK